MDIGTQQLKDRKIIEIVLQSRYRILRHVSFSLGFILLLYNSDFPNQFSGLYKYYWLVLVYLVFVIMFYINMYLLVPLIFKGKYVSYFLSLILMIFLGLILLNEVMTIYFDKYRILETRVVNIFRFRFVNGLFISTPFIMVSTTIKLFQQWVKDNERITELQKLALSTELSELKNQISPHFLFNMLNNVKVLIRKNPEMAITVIMKLSEFLRYQLYENNQEKTSLKAEITFLSNFLNLEKIRRDNLNFSLESEIQERKTKNILIPPNLFTIFVENAVKHSADINDQGTYINIDILVEEKKLHFTCKNSIGSEHTISDKKHSGLGLVNIKRRLELLYANTYCLEIKENKKEYTVTLIIPI